MSKPASMSLPPRQPVKGEATASVTSIEPAPTAPAAVEHAPTLPPNVKALGGMVAVTVRMDRETYEGLKMHGLRTRQTNQDILLGMIKQMLRANAQ
jgi:hypothetical protein